MAKKTKKVEKKTEATTVKPQAKKIMTINTLTDNVTEEIAPTTQEVEGKTWVKTTSKRRDYDVN